MAHITRSTVSVLLVLELLLAGCGEDSPMAPTSNTIGPEGGTFAFAGGDVTLVFPAGALSEEITVTVTAAAAFPDSPRLAGGTAYDFEPDGIQFAQPVQLTIGYNAANLPAGVREAELRLNEVVGTAWREVASSSADPSADEVSGSIAGFSTFGALGVPVASVNVLPDSAVIQVGQPLQLSAMAMDAALRELPDRSTTWMSSDAAIASVSSQGLVTGMATGGVTITAVSEGQNGTAAVNVVAQAQPTLQLVASGLSSPVFVGAPPGDTTRLFIVELSGRIRIVRNDTLLAAPFLDIRSIVTGGGEQGLFAVAFHPSYAQNGRFFVHYTDVNGDTRVASYQVSADPDVADAGSAAIVLSATQPFSNHNGGQIEFGPDGMLYIALGDGGSGGDPLGHGQDLGTLLGTILRIDVDGALPYAIPSDNPFVSDNTALDEIWAYGLRNPWRFSFDRSTGDLYIADVGQNQLEEVDVQAASSGGGGNYGWNTMEGTNCFNPSTNCNQTGLILPALEYTHAEGCSITGGYVYRGTRVPALAGHYLYADYCSGFVRSFRYQNGQATDLRDWSSTLAPGGSIVSFGEDARGELYIVTLGGSVHRVIATGM